MLHWPPTTFEISKFIFSPSYHRLQRPRCHLHVANRINFFVIFWNGKWEERIFCTTHGVPAVCTHCHMTGMPWFLSCGSIYVTPCQEWLLGQKAQGGKLEVDYFTSDFRSRPKVTWDLTMKKKSKIYKNYMNRKIIQTYTVETLQLFTLCLWTMLQHVKVGHIALSQMVIFIFGLNTPHLIYLGPCNVCELSNTY